MPGPPACLGALPLTRHFADGADADEEAEEHPAEVWRGRERLRLNAGPKPAPRTHSLKQGGHPDVGGKAPRRCCSSQRLMAHLPRKVLLKMRMTCPDDMMRNGMRRRCKRGEASVHGGRRAQEVSPIGGGGPICGWPAVDATARTNATSREPARTPPVHCCAAACPSVVQLPHEIRLVVPPVAPAQATDEAVGNDKFLTGNPVPLSCSLVCASTLYQSIASVRRGAVRRSDVLLERRARGGRNPALGMLWPAHHSKASTKSGRRSAYSTAKAKASLSQELPRRHSGKGLPHRGRPRPPAFAQRQGRRAKPGARSKPAVACDRGGTHMR